MSDDIRELKESVQRIERGLFGEAKLKQKGFIETQLDHEKRLTRIERIGLYVSGACGFATLLWTIFSQWPRK